MSAIRGSGENIVPHVASGSIEGTSSHAVAMPLPNHLGGASSQNLVQREGDNEPSFIQKAFDRMGQTDLAKIFHSTTINVGNKIARAFGEEHPFAKAAGLVLGGIFGSIAGITASAAYIAGKAISYSVWPLIFAATIGGMIAGGFIGAGMGGVEGAIAGGVVGAAVGSAAIIVLAELGHYVVKLSALGADNENVVGQEATEMRNEQIKLVKNILNGIAGIANIFLGNRHNRLF